MNVTPEEAEFYPTPAWCVRRLLEAIDLTGRVWLEPCVGEGAIVKAVNETRQDVCWTANDIRAVPRLECYDALWERNFSHYSSTANHWDVGITNPPFSKALPILRQLLRVCDQTALLLPLAWPTGHERFDFLREHPADILALPDRPWENVRDVGWFMWPTQGLGYRILNRTPLDERKADAAAVEMIRYAGPRQILLGIGGNEA